MDARGLAARAPHVVRRLGEAGKRLASPSLPADAWSRSRSRLPDRRVAHSAATAGKTVTAAVSSLYEHAIDRMLSSGERVRSAAEGKALLASEERSEAVADHVQRVVARAIPLLRLVARGARFTKVPWAFVASAAITVGLTVRTGAHEVQTLGSLIAHRIEETTGTPADPGLVKKLTVELYLAPKRPPDLRDRRLRLDRLVRRWVLRGALGRGPGNSGVRALDAAERLDIHAQLARWEQLSQPSRKAPAGGRPSF